MADAVWPDEDPLGKRFSFSYLDEPEWLTVVGVAADVSQWGLEWGTIPEAYRAYPLYPRQTMYLAVKTEVPPGTVVAGVRRAVQTLDPTLPVTRIRTGEQIFGEHLGQRKFTTSLIGLFALLALLLSIAGVYGIMAYHVAQHSHELGVRMALGAGPAGLLRHVLKEGLALAVVGVIAGAGGAVSASVITRGLLFGVSPVDPRSVTAVVVLILAVAALATLLPALRATRVNPARTLQAE
jgi:ABC-type antimicrobial peptide transport system permease subunit